MNRTMTRLEVLSAPFSLNTPPTSIRNGLITVWSRHFQHGKRYATLPQTKWQVQSNPLACQTSRLLVFRVLCCCSLNSRSKEAQNSSQTTSMTNSQNVLQRRRG